jgi:hypothetical protein
MSLKAIPYVRWKDLYVDNPPDLDWIKNTLKKFNREEIVDLICWINFMMTHLTDKDKIYFQNVLLRQLLQKENMDKADVILTKGNQIFFFKHQLLYLLRLLLSQDSKSGSKIMDEPFVFGKLFFAVTYHVDPEFQYLALTGKGGSDSRYKALPFFIRNQWLNVFRF